MPPSGPFERRRPAPAVAWLLVAALAACRSAPQSSVPPARAESLERFEAGERFRRMGLEDRALAEFEIAIAVDENCVEAHREYQNLMRARCQERELLRAYRERLANDPQNPAWHYLLGRMLPDPDEQRDAFARAVRLDPKFFWGHYGLGYQAEVRGEIEAARGHYGRAVALDPARPIARLRLGDLERRARQPARAEAQYQTVIGLQPEEPDGYLGLALLLEEKRRGHDALHVCREAIQRRPADLAAQAVYRSLLAQYGAHSDFRDALDLLEGAVREAPVTASLELTRAVCAQGLGEVLPAIDGYSRAIRLGASPIGIAGALRLLHVRQGDYGAALRDFEVVAPPALLFDPENVIRFIFEELYAATSAAAERPSDAAPLLRLAEAYAACGWVAEAISQFHRVLYVDPGNPRARVGLERAVRHERFVRRLRERILEGYRRAAAGQESDGFAASLRGALAEIDLMGREILERNVAAPRRLREYAFIGAQLDPSIDSDDALMAYLREWNQILLLGRRAGSPTEALLLHRIAVFPKRPRRTASGTIEFDEVIGGQSAIPSLREHQGARLGGVTFEGMFVIHFDTVLAWQERARRAFQSFHLDAESLLSAPAAPAPTRALQQRVGHTFCLEEKLYLRAYHDYLENQRGIRSRSQVMAEDWRLLLSVVESHELGHLRDAERFLPIWAHPLRALGLLIGRGFSAARIEAFFEENAELNALVASDSPWLALAEIVSFLPFEDGVLPHSAAYARLLRAILGQISRNLSDYPSIDPEQNILQQLHRLSAGELRHAARRVARGRGLEM